MRKDLKQLDDLIEKASKMLSKQLGISIDEIPKDVVERNLKRAAAKQFDEFAQNKDEVMLAIYKILETWNLEFAIIVWSPISDEDGVLSSIKEEKMIELLEHYLIQLKNGRFKKKKVDGN